MPWWGWIALGAMLLIAEMTIVDLEFYLVFLGASALIVGLTVASGVAMPFAVQWIVFAVLSVVSLVFFRRQLYSRLRPPPDSDVREGVSGDRAVALEAIEPGARGSVTLRGTSWTGKNVGTTAIPAQGECLVVRSEGLVLELRLGD